MKKGGPTETVLPVSAFRNNGYNVPMKTVAHIVVSSRLFSTSPPSRLIGWNSPPIFSEGARIAERVSAPPVAATSSPSTKMPRAGSSAKEWTLVVRPERTRKVPIRERLKVRIDSRMVQLLSASRFSTTMAEWSSAVPASQGISEAFSTGSQNQKPPQPRM